MAALPRLLFNRRGDDGGSLWVYCRGIRARYEVELARYQHDGGDRHAKHGQHKIVKVVHHIRNSTRAGWSHRLWLSARALVENNSGSKDLWLSATGAVVNGGQWLRLIERRTK